MALKKYMIRQHLREEGKYLNYRIGSEASFVKGFFETENPETQGFIEDSASYPSIIVDWKPDTVSEKLTEADLEIQQLRDQVGVLQVEKLEREAEDDDGELLVDISDLSDMAYAQMKKACAERGLDASGKMDVVKARLIQWKAVNDG